MSEPIANAQIQELADTICGLSRWPTQSEIRQAIALAYNMGKTDGSLETCERLMKKGAVA